MAETFELSVSNMNCQHCSGAVTRAVEAVVGTGDVVVSLEKAKVTFLAESDDVKEVVRKAIEEAGYPVGS